MTDDGPYEKATFAAGCFWGIEAAFRRVKGVVATAVGYTGGTIPEPSYETVSTGTTGHAEAVEVTFDPVVVSYERLLDLFWSIHDPTQLNRQGPDIGSNYRSAIFCHSPEQHAAAIASKRKLEATGKFRGHNITTEIVPASTFWPAEEYISGPTRSADGDTARCQRTGSRDGWIPGPRANISERRMNFPCQVPGNRIFPPDNSCTTRKKLHNRFPGYIDQGMMCR